MDVNIGVQHTARDISIETEESADSITAKVTEAINSDGLLSLTDTKGRVVLVPGSKIAYIDLGPAAGRRVGFGK
jgi:hypothetical protein